MLHIPSTPAALEIGRWGLSQIPKGFAGSLFRCEALEHRSARTEEKAARANPRNLRLIILVDGSLSSAPRSRLQGDAIILEVDKIYDTQQYVTATVKRKAQGERRAKTCCLAMSL